MRKTFLRQKQNAATHDLLIIDQEQTIKEIKEAYDPFKAQFEVKCQKILTRKKIRTEVSSPKKVKRQDNFAYLKQSLEKLKRQSVQLGSTNFLFDHKQEQPKHMILRSINLENNNSGRSTVQQLYKNKQKSQQKMRPLVMIENLRRSQQEQEQKIRSLIKRKILAKDLFKRVKGHKVEAPSQRHSKVFKKQNQLNKIHSEKKGLKKNLIFHNKQRHYLPHIV